ncbi:MAG TPA: ATP-binding protein, partial [Nocardioidaceae bacterium]
EEMAPSLGTHPVVTFEGPLDLALSAAVGDELVVALQELLSNVARHAHASRVTVSVVVAGGLVTLQVDDDGVGPPDGSQPSSGLGLHNLATRAERLDGHFALHRGAESGTTAVWSARSA